MLYIVSTPIGNLEDITLRAIRILGEIDFVLAEDTRKTGFLLKHIGIKKNLISFYEHNEVKRIPFILEELKKGKNIALVSNAGTPTISDPGYKLIRECRKISIPIISIPGVSSVITALSLTSLGHEKFIFLGYVSRKQGERKKIFNEIKKHGITSVFFESPYRIKKTLADLKDVLGDKKITVLREMTKKFEEILEMRIQEIIEVFGKKKPKGEIVLIV